MCLCSLFRQYRCPPPLTDLLNYSCASLNARKTSAAADISCTIWLRARAPKVNAAEQASERILRQSNWKLCIHTHTHRQHTIRHSCHHLYQLVEIMCLCTVGGNILIKLYNLLAPLFSSSSSCSSVFKRDGRVNDKWLLWDDFANDDGDDLSTVAQMILSLFLQYTRYYSAVCVCPTTTLNVDDY